MSTCEDYSCIMSDDEFEKNVDFRVVRHYFRAYPEDKPEELLGLELIVPEKDKEYTYSVNSLEPGGPDWPLVDKYFEENPDSHHCYYPYTKEEINLMIKRLEYMRDNMED